MMKYQTVVEVSCADCGTVSVAPKVREAAPEYLDGLQLPKFKICLTMPLLTLM